MLKKVANDLIAGLVIGGAAYGVGLLAAGYFGWAGALASIPIVAAGYAGVRLTDLDKKVQSQIKV